MLKPFIILQMSLQQKKLSLKCLLLIIFGIVGAPIVGIIYFLTGYIIIGIIVYIVFIYFFLRYVGRFVMYPGSTLFVQQELQKQFSLYLIQNWDHILTHTLTILEKIMKKQFFLADMGYIERNITNIIDMLSMYESSLSPTKTHLLKLYRKLFRQLQQFPKYNNKDYKNTNSILWIVNNPPSVKHLGQDQQFINQIALSACKTISQITTTMSQYRDPSKNWCLSKIKYLIFDQKLYEMRFSYFNWNNTYIYDKYLIPTHDKELIETVIIHQQKNDRVVNAPKTVLFCNPNGVFLQFFGLDNQYIRFYLRNGFRIILWNYRGYGASTGIPSIKLSQIDAQHVYQFYSNLNYNIQIVHGYSIGGCAAISVAHKNTNINVLVADRTFSRISQIARDYGTVLHRLTKLIFWNDDILIHHQYQQCKNKHKIMIWDNFDEVIKESCSLKKGVVEQIVLSNKLYCSKESLNQQNYDGTGFNYAAYIPTNSLFQRFQTVFVAIFYQYTKQSSNTFYNEKIQNKSSFTDSMQSNNELHKLGDDLIEIMKSIDGGGIVLFSQHYLFSLFSQFNKNIPSICRNYLLNLCCYGCCLSFQDHNFTNASIKANTLTKIQAALNKIIQLKRFYQTIGFPLEKLRNLQQFWQIFKQISEIIERGLNDQQYHLKIGVLLPTANGHNGQLLSIQFDVLRQFVNRVKQNNQNIDL